MEEKKSQEQSQQKSDNQGDIIKESAIKIEGEPAPKPWANWGANTRWGHGQPAPTSEQKKAGWARKKRNRELAQMVLGMKFVGQIYQTDAKGNPILDKDGNPKLMDSEFKRRLASYFGLSKEQIDSDDMTNEMALMLRQLGQAIENGDTTSAQMVLERAYGKPKEFIELSRGEEEQPMLNINVVNVLPDSNNQPVEMPPILEDELPEQTKPANNEQQNPDVKENPLQ